MKQNIHMLFRIVTGLMLCILFAGCAAGFEDLIRSEHEGKRKTYPVQEEQAWMLARTVFLWKGALEAEIAEKSTEKTLVWEGVMWALIEPLDKDRTRVTVKKAAIPCNPVSPILTEEEFHTRFAYAVDMLKAGRTLPKELPK